MGEVHKLISGISGCGSSSVKPPHERSIRLLGCPLMHHVLNVLSGCSSSRTSTPSSASQQYPATGYSCTPMRDAACCTRSAPNNAKRWYCFQQWRSQRQLRCTRMNEIVRRVLDRPTTVAVPEPCSQGIDYASSSVGFSFCLCRSKRS